MTPKQIAELKSLIIEGDKAKIKAFCQAIKHDNLQFKFDENDTLEIYWQDNTRWQNNEASQIVRQLNPNM